MTRDDIIARFMADPKDPRALIKDCTSYLWLFVENNPSEKDIVTYLDNALLKRLATNWSPWNRLSEYEKQLLDKHKQRVFLVNESNGVTHLSIDVAHKFSDGTGNHVPRYVPPKFEWIECEVRENGQLFDKTVNDYVSLYDQRPGTFAVQFAGQDNPFRWYTNIFVNIKTSSRVPIEYFDKSTEAVVPAIPDRVRLWRDVSLCR